MKRSIILLVAVFAMASCRHDDVAGKDTGCIDQSKVNPNGLCTFEYNPVCGCDGKTYGNACAAGNAGVTRWTKGACAK